MLKSKLKGLTVILAGGSLLLSLAESGFAQESASRESMGKTRAAIYAEIESTLGIVPSFFKMVPDTTLELEWELMKRVQMEPGPIPNKYRELIGLSVSAATRCEYCTFFHTEFARLNGATEAEIEDALHYTKSTMGWSTYINGTQVDLDSFKREVRTIVEYLTKKTAAEQEAVKKPAGGK